MPAEPLRLLLAIFLIVMFGIALLYLSRRQLTLRQSLAWGVFALLVPVLGPLLVIALRPGKPRCQITTGVPGGGELNEK